MSDFSNQVKKAFVKGPTPEEVRANQAQLIAQDIVRIAKLEHDSVLRYAAEHKPSERRFKYQSYIVYRPNVYVDPQDREVDRPKYVVDTESVKKGFTGLETHTITTKVSVSGYAFAQQLSETLGPDGFDVGPWNLLQLSWDGEYECPISLNGGHFLFLEDNNYMQRPKVLHGPYELRGEVQQVFKPRFKKEYTTGMIARRLYRGELHINSITVETGGGPGTRFLPCITVRYEDK